MPIKPKIYVMEYATDEALKNQENNRIHNEDESVLTDDDEDEDDNEKI